MALRILLVGIEEEEGGGEGLSIIKLTQVSSGGDVLDEETNPLG